MIDDQVIKILEEQQERLRKLTHDLSREIGWRGGDTLYNEEDLPTQTLGSWVKEKIKRVFYEQHDCVKDGHLYGPYKILAYGFSIDQSKGIREQFANVSPKPDFKIDSQVRMCHNCGLFDFLNVDWI